MSQSKRTSRKEDHILVMHCFSRLKTLCTNLPHLLLTSFSPREVLALPSDVWVVLVDYLDLFEVLSLWITGSLLIRQRLGAQGGWKNFCVLPMAAGLESVPLLQWPRCLLPQLSGLCRLHLYPPHPKVILPLLRPAAENLAQLPNGLVDLELGFVDCLDDHHLPSLPLTLTRLALPLNNSISHSGLAHLPPGLETLELGSNRRLSDPSFLPRNLLYFTGNSESFVPSETTFTGFPPDLIALKLQSSRRLPIHWNMPDLSGFSNLGSLEALSIRPIYSSNPTLEHPQFPPQLTSLELIGNPAIDGESLSRLPRSLLTLKLLFLMKVDLSWERQWIMRLPMSLTDLQVMPADFEDLAEHLSSPTTHFPCRCTLPSDCIAYMPPGLKTLRLMALTVPPGTLSTQGGQLPWIPMTLSQNATAVLDTDAAHLPQQSLTDLYIKLQQESTWHANVFPSLHLLPPGLVRFTASSFSLDNIPEFDPRRTSSSIADPSLYPASFAPIENDPANFQFPILPRNLTSVCIGSDVVGDLLKPAPVVVSTVTKSEWSRRLLDKLWKEINVQLPNLHTLGLSSFPSKHIPLLKSMRLTKLTLYSCVPSLQDKDVLDLPDSLTALEVNASNLTDECVPALPKDLVYFSVGSPHKIQGDLYPWPLKLKSLKLGELNSQYIHSSDYVARNASTALMYIPHLITDLTMESPFASDRNFIRPPATSSSTFNSNTSSSSSIFSKVLSWRPWNRTNWDMKLPPFLTRLCIPFSRHISSAIIHMLPNTMCDIRIAYIQLEDEDVQYLPRGLRVFSAERGCNDLGDPSASDWPPLLETLIVKGTLFTNDGVRKLPRTLQTLQLSNSIFVDQSLITEITAAHSDR